MALPSSATLARSYNIDRAAEHSKNLQDFSNLSCWLTCFEIHNEPYANARDAGKLVLPEVLLFTCCSDQSANIG